jgi:hypothetical protein
MITFRKFKLSWTTLRDTHQFSDPIAPSYHKFQNLSSNVNYQPKFQTYFAQNETAVKSDVDLIEAAMKMNSRIAGGAAEDNLAHQFYWYIPHPSLPFVDRNLSKYGRDLYKNQTTVSTMNNLYKSPQQSDYPQQAYDYGTQQYNYGTQQYDYGTQQYDYGAQQYDYGTQQYSYSYQPPVAPTFYPQNYDYPAYYGETDIQEEAKVKQMQPPDVVYYEDVNREEIYFHGMSKEEAKERNEIDMVEGVDENLILF